MRGSSPFWRRDWSGRRDSNSRPSPWQGDALPLSYFRATCDASASAAEPLPLRGTMWASRDSNSDGFPHWNLNPARLPIPPFAPGRALRFGTPTCIPRRARAPLHLPPRRAAASGARRRKRPAPSPFAARHSSPFPLEDSLANSAAPAAARTVRLLSRSSAHSIARRHRGTKRSLQSLKHCTYVDFAEAAPLAPSRRPVEARYPFWPSKTTD